MLITDNYMENEIPTFTLMAPYTSHYLKTYTSHHLKNCLLPAKKLDLVSVKFLAQSLPC